MANDDYRISAIQIGNGYIASNGFLFSVKKLKSFLKHETAGTESFSGSPFLRPFFSPTFFCSSVRVLLTKAETALGFLETNNQ